MLFIDPSQRNFAMVLAEVNGSNINPLAWEIPNTGKYGLLESARIINDALKKYIPHCDYAVAELPSGSLSSSAAGALALCIGILGCMPLKLYTYSPKEVKSVVRKGASKAEMVKWATRTWPNFNWRTYQGSPTVVVNQHIADALAVGVYHVSH